MSKKYNFYAGPAILAPEVLKQASEAAIEFDNMGLSILEISHRTPQFVSVMNEAVSLTKELLGLGDDFEVLFLTGGASSQFYMTAMNFLTKDDKAAYINTGTWSKKAIKEAKLYGDIIELASSADSNFNYIPKDFEVSEDLAYLHVTSNNTIFGTQFHSFPESGVPMICDMSSDIFSRELDIDNFDMIYAGAQKNMGPAGTTLVCIRKTMLDSIKTGIPSMLNYQTHVDKDSSFNTPPVFPIYVSLLTLRWLKANGGVAAMEVKNKEKAAVLYNEIDRNPLFEGTANREDRSLMNVTFVMKDSSQEQAFLELAESRGCVGIKGHRSVGGFRASIYNAMSLEGIETLVKAMQDFELNN